MSDVIRHVMIRGHVQGVGFRYWTTREALRFGLAGWVRNRRDGSVEALFVGPAEVVTEMMARCRTGPDSARVEAIEDQPVMANAEKMIRPGERFSQLPTA